MTLGWVGMSGLQEAETHRALRSRRQHHVPADVDLDLEPEVIDVELAAGGRVVDDEEDEVLAWFEHAPQRERSRGGRVKRGRWCARYLARRGEDC